MRSFAALAASQKTFKKLIVGPWPHGVGGRECGDVWFGEAAGIQTMVYMADWFGHWLKRKPTLIGPEAVGLSDGAETGRGLPRAG
jgi:hypothetical protein